MALITKLQSIFILIIIATILSVTFYQGTKKDFDDAKYLLYAHQMLNGTFSISQSPYAYGFGFIALTATSMALTSSPVLPEALAYVAMCIILFSVLTKHFDTQIALIGALSSEFSAFVFLYSTRLLPDMILGLMIAQVLWIFTWRNDDPRWLWIAGLIIGCSIFIKMGAVPLFLGLIPAYYFIYSKRIQTLIAGAAIGLIAYVLLLPAGSSIFVMFVNYGALQVRLSNATLWTNISLLFFWTLGYWPTDVFPQLFPLGALFIFAIIGSWWARAALKGDYAYMAAFLWLNLLYMLFGTESLTSWVFLTVVDRYLTYVVVSFAFFACVCYTKLEKIDPRLPWLALLILIASNVPMYLYFL